MLTNARLFIAAASMAALASVVPAAQAQSAAGGCKERVSEIEVESSRMREDEQRSRGEAEALAASHPLVVKLADGRIVALSDEEELSKPLESWMRAVDVNRQTEQDLGEARKLLEANKEDDCLKLLEPYKFNRG